MVDFIVQPPQHRRGGQLPHPQRRDPAADGHAERRRHDARGPVDRTSGCRTLGAKLTGYPAISIFHDFKYHPKEIDHRHPGLGLRAPGRAVLDGGDLGPEQGSRHHRLPMDRVVPRPPARGRPQAAEVERRPVRRPGPRRLVPLPPPAAGHGGARRLGQDELLAQPAAAPARARGGALPGLADADRAVAAAAGAAARRGAGAGQRHLAHPLRGGQQPATCRPTSPSARWSARPRAARCSRSTCRRASAWSAARSASRARTWKATRPKSSLQAFLPSREITADRAVVEWVVTAPRGSTLALTATADRAGTVRTEVTLD